MRPAPGRAAVGTSPRVLLLAALLTGCGSSTPGGTSGGSPAPQPTPDGPPTGPYGCLLLTLSGGLPTYVPSTPGTVTLGVGNTYAAASYPGSGTSTHSSASRRLTFRQGAPHGVNAAFERLEDGTPVLRLGENLEGPAPEVEIGESVCQGER